MVKKKSENVPEDINHHHLQHSHQNHGRSRPRGSMAQSSCCCPCLGVSFVVKGIGRCLFVSCYPVIQCFGLDEGRHLHHHHRHFY
ncbi:hypothetical protein CRG98_014686 [Punica granatum]|uniref:Uncharacterized protein n=1 Tax=Punica granatum TaxID=22663 RepID=A0A2I0K9N7_PUNGR|nr:hypothetical protein CRG98_014686 [Punica granatum]